MSQICVIRPENDAAAVDLSKLAVSLNTSISASSSHTLCDLLGTSATRSAVETELPRSRVTVFFGHGSKSRLQGVSSDLIDTSNVGKAAGQLIIAIACSSSYTLGPTATDATNKVEAYLGFNESLAWITGDPDGQFEMAFNSGVEAMLAGNTIGSAFSEMEKTFYNAFSYYKTGTGSSSPNSIIGWLIADWDKRHLQLHGNSSASL